MMTVELSELELRDGDRILDLGCGEGRHLHGCFYAANVHAVGVDLPFDDVLRTREGFEALAEFQAKRGPTFSLAVTNALALPFADDSFDKIICSEVLEHLPDYKSALHEIDRLLKPGGLLAISVPRAWPEWICWRLSRDYRTTPGGHVRIFNARELKSDIERLGLSFRRRHGAHALHAPYWWLKCAFWNNQEKSWIIRQYHNLLVWDLMKKPWATRLFERFANPLLGKSVVLYFSKTNERNA